jgi:DNA polymerase-3 subunit delta
MPAKNNCYFIFGAEIFLINNQRDLLKKQYADHEHILYLIDQQFNWEDLYNNILSPALFYSAKLIDCIINIKLNNNIIENFYNLQQNLAENIILLVSYNQYLSRADKHKKYYKIIEQNFQVHEHNTPSLSQYIHWLKEQIKKYNLNFAPQALDYFVYKTSKNMQIAAEELQKLAILHQPISCDLLREILQDHATYGLFDLQEAFIHKNMQQCMAIMQALQRANIAPLLIVWALGEDLRLLLKASLQQHIAAPAYKMRLIKNNLRLWQQATIFAMLRGRYDLEKSIKSNPENAYNEIIRWICNY